MALTERAWQDQVVEIARLYGWAVYHTYDSRRSESGWPDLALAREPEFLVAELKTDKGRLSPAQVKWLSLLGSCGIETAVWRPRDFQVVHERLKRRY